MHNYDIYLFFLLSYLIGSIPFAVFFGKIFYNTDVRDYGSFNAGATNVLRVLGWKPALLVLFFDIFKGWFSLYFITFLNDFLFHTQYKIEVLLIFAFASVIGHIFPVYVGFKGGKGIATLLGVLIAIYSYSVLITIIIFLIILFMFRFVSLASVISSISFPFLILFSGNDNIYLIIFAILVPFITLITHKKNIVRLLNGKETKINFVKNK